MFSIQGGVWGGGGGGGYTTHSTHCHVPNFINLSEVVAVKSLTDKQKTKQNKQTDRH